MPKDKYSNEHFFRTIKELINHELDLGESYKSLSEKTNVPAASLNEYYNGQRVATAENLIKLSSYFNVSVDYLLGLNSNQNIEHVCNYLDISYTTAKNLKDTIANIKETLSTKQISIFAPSVTLSAYSASTISSKAIDAFFDCDINFFNDLILSLIEYRWLTDVSGIAQRDDIEGLDEITKSQLNYYKYVINQNIINNVFKVSEKMGIICDD